jgi:hypothetical protein
MTNTIDGSFANAIGAYSRWGIGGTMTESPPRLRRRAQLVQQDIHIAREEPGDGSSRVVARVHCARRNCAMEVEECAACAHFARIEVHEAGYLLLCTAHAEARETDDVPGDGPKAEPED